MAAVALVHGVVMLLTGLALQGPLLSLEFNFEVSPAAVFNSSISKQFGYQVLQIGEGPEARIIVGAPGEQNSIGKVYQCEMQSEKCEDIPLEGSSGMPHFGMTLAGNTRGSMIVCGPGNAQHCDKNLYVSGICYLIDVKHHKRRNITTGYQKCLKGNVDLVFLFDGSESMNSEDFNTIKEFMISVMEKLHNSTIHFAAVQFSLEVSVAFHFEDYIRDPNPRKLLANVEHMASITNTFTAIKYVTKNVFTSEHGMRKEANKVMIIITDGGASDDNKASKGIIEAAKEKGILRLVIGVGQHFNSPESQQVLQTIASEPTQQFVKVLSSFEALKDSFNDLQSKIYNIEGTSDGGSFHLELSSSGFSADISQDRIVLGAVGADNWAGGLFEQQEGLIGEKFITTPTYREEMNGAYLGYSLAALQRQQKTFYAAGAPRYQHVGRVLIFEAKPSPINWTITQEIKGEQIGSYFGGVLCSVDLDGNKETDLLLIGAPHYFEDMQGGLVYVYSWAQASLVSQGKLKGDKGYPLGKFGAAITDLADINGDGLADVAVGAPLEDENRGAVYIYHGLKKTLQMQYSQKIQGASVSPSLMFFGQSIHGKTDLSRDGLTDMLVGALGNALVLRSRPIVSVETTYQCHPKEIPVENKQCLQDAGQKETVSFTICFHISLATKSYQGFMSANLSFHMEIDPKRMKNRGEFSTSSKILRGVKEVSLKPTCLQQTIHIKNCLEDYVTPINIFIKFSLGEESEFNKKNVGPVLNPLTSNTTVEIPFEKNCGEDGVCEANLRISFHNSSSKELLASSKTTVDLRLELENHKEDAYFASVHIPYMPGLSYRRGSPVTPGILVRCDGLLEDQNPRDLTCNISHPIYKGGMKAMIELQYGIIEGSSWEDNFLIEAYVKSKNEANMTLQDNKAVLRIPVRYPVSIIIRELETNSHYVNFSSLHQENKTVTHSYEVKNSPINFVVPPALTVFVMVPTTFPVGLTWDVGNIRTEPPVTCRLIETDNRKKSQIEWDKKCVLDEYHTYQCHLGQINSSLIHISGVMSTKSKTEQFRFKFCTGVWLTFDTRRYKNIYNTEFVAQYQVGEAEMILEMDYLPVMIGSGIGGLFLLILIIAVLYKCGFFKRNYKEKLDHQGENVAEMQSEGSQENESEQAVKAEAKAEGDQGFTELLNGEVETK